jgi:hypothetical protein
LIRLWGEKFERTKDSTFKFALLYQKLRDKGVPFAKDYEYLNLDYVNKFKNATISTISNESSTSLKLSSINTPRDRDFEQPFSPHPQ